MVLQTISSTTNFDQLGVFLDITSVIPALVVPSFEIKCSLFCNFCYVLSPVNNVSH